MIAPVAGEVTAEAAPTAAAPTASAPTAAAAATAAAQAAGRAVKAFEKRPFYTRELGLAHPTGATYLDGPRLLAVAQGKGRVTAIRLLDPRSEKVRRPREAEPSASLPAPSPTTAGGVSPPSRAARS